MDSGYIVDLETGIPIMQNTSRSPSIDIVNKNIHKGFYQIDQIQEITQQRKLSKNNIFLLGVETPCILYTSVNLTVLEEHKRFEKEALAGKPVFSNMKDVFELMDFAAVIKGNTLFHRYAADD